MFRVLFSIPFWCIGLYALVAVFVPRWRSPWRRTRVIAGGLAHFGFGLVFTAGGAILLFAKNNRDAAVLLLAAIPLVVGVLLVFVGYWLDFRRNSTRHLAAAGKRPTRQR